MGLLIETSHALVQSQILCNIETQRWATDDVHETFHPAEVTNATSLDQFPRKVLAVLQYGHTAPFAHTVPAGPALGNSRARAMAKGNTWQEVGDKSHVSAQNGAAVSGISDIEAARMHQQHDCGAARPGAFPGSRPAHPPNALRPLLILHAQQLPVNILAAWIAG